MNQHPFAIGADSPWGVIEEVTQIAPGVYILDTNAHGGLCLDLYQYRPHLSAYALTLGSVWQGYLCFEEDCEVSVPLWEHPEWINAGLCTRILEYAWYMFASLYPTYDALGHMNPAFMESYPLAARSALAVFAQGIGKRGYPAKNVE